MHAYSDFQRHTSVSISTCSDICSSVYIITSLRSLFFKWESGKRFAMVRFLFTTIHVPIMEGQQYTVTPFACYLR